MSVGASEIAALFGCSPWESEYSMWCRHVGLYEKQEDTERLRVGRFLEKAILEEWCGRMGIVATHNTTSFTHQTNEWIRATPDGIGDGLVVDVKTVEPMRRGDWAGGVPEYYRLQLQQQMLVRGVDRAFLVALFGFGELAHEEVQADFALQAEIVSRIDTFRQRVEGTLPPPPVDGHKATTAALMGQKHVEGIVSLSPEARAWSDRYIVLAAQRKAIEAEQREISNKIRAALSGNTKGTFADGTGWQIINVKESTSVRKASTQLRRITNKQAEEWSEE